MTDPICDLDDAELFLDTLGGAGPFVFQTFGDKKDEKGEADPRLARNATLPWATARAWLIEANRNLAGIFVTVNATDGQGREAANVTALRALFVDVDGTRELPATWPLAPSIIVQRDATHWHAYWLLRPGEDLRAFTPAQVHLACHWLSDLSVSDLPRVMRLPGFLHHKGDAMPVALVRADGAARYTIAEVLAAHPVDWLALPDKARRKAAACGLCEPAEQPQRRAPEQPRPAAAGGDFQAESYRKWAAKRDVREGAANDYEGRDNAAFALACEGAGRAQAGLIPRGLVEEVVLEYLHRAGVADPQADAQRIIGSAFSKPRTCTPPAAPQAGRPARDPAKPRPTFDDAAPPEPPSAAPAAAAPEPEKPYDGLDLDALRNRWSVTDGGVAPIEWNAKAGQLEVKINKRIGNLPIWPAQVGRDVATGNTYLRLGWVTPDGETRHDWMPEEAVKEGKPLLRLHEGPIAGPRWQQAAVFLTEARPAITQPLAMVTSRLGWCGVNGSRRWVWPGTGEEAGAVFIGDDLPAHGKLEGWQRGLEHVLSLGRPGYVALLCAVLSAAAPWARLVNGKRNPVIGLQARSSSGKGSVLTWALAIWADAEALTLPASSSVKGLQDRAVQYPDLPIFCDELQQLLEQGSYGQNQAQEAVYFLANGQRRVTSSKTQVSVGGEARHGVGFYAAEAPILTGLNRGVHMRTIELRQDPCPDEATARILRQAGQHSGVLAEEISRRVQAAGVGEWIESLRAASAALRSEHQGLEAGDSDTLALVQRGCDLLEGVCGVELPTADLVAWLAQEIAQQRASAIDRERACLQAVLDWLGNLDWTTEDSDGRISYRKEIALQLHMIAWSTWRVVQSGTVRESLECDPTHRELAAIFERYGGERRVLPSWAAQGWIERQDKNLKVRRRGFGRVVRFTRAALVEHFGEADIAPAEPAAEVAP